MFIDICCIDTMRYRTRNIYATMSACNELKYQFLVAFNSLSTREKIAEFANSLDLDEVAYNEPPHLDLHCLLSSL